MRHSLAAAVPLFLVPGPVFGSRNSRHRPRSRSLLPICPVVRVEQEQTPRSPVYNPQSDRKLLSFVNKNCKFLLRSILDSKFCSIFSNSSIVRPRRGSSSVDPSRGPAGVMKPCFSAVLPFYH